MTTRVLALDLSLAATGICDANGDHDVYRPTAKGDWRLRQIANVITEQHLLSLPFSGRGLVPHLVVLEDLPMGLRNAAAGSLGMLHGAIRYQLLENDTPFLTVPPATLKTYSTGRGNAPKPDMRMELYKRTGLDVPDDNAVDARWLWYLAHDLLGTPVLELPQTHRRALTKLQLPQGVTPCSSS